MTMSVMDDQETAAREEKEVALLNSYLSNIETWRSGREFSGDATAVEEAQNSRLKLASKISARPHLISDPKLAEINEYLSADIAFLDRPDPGAQDYAEFARHREILRDRVFHGKSVLTHDDYERVAGRLHRMIDDGKFIEDQFEMLDLRREAAAEHFDDPRFIMGVARSKRDLLDEFYVDLDRSDLLNPSAADAARHDAQKDIFERAVARLSMKNSPATHKVESFMLLREVGVHLRHNQALIADFAMAHDEGSRESKLGLAALENTRFGEGMFEDWVKGLSREQTRFIREKKGAAAVFVVAHRQFCEQIESGSDAAGQTFAILERAAQDIHTRQSLRRKLNEIGGPDDLAALNFFGNEHRKHVIDQFTQDLDDKVVEKMDKDVILDGRRIGDLSKEDNKGRVYDLELGDDTDIEVIDGSHIRIANSSDDLEAGQGLILRLSGAVSPPPGTMSKSEKIDAGLAAKENLEGLIARHGLVGLGLEIQTLKSGESVVKATLRTGEDLAERQIRDGFALPTMEEKNSARREMLGKQASGNKRGLWREGFPKMEINWRREKNAPELTWRDKRQHLDQTMRYALCTSPEHVGRNLSRSETRAFALPLQKWSGSHLIDKEVLKVLDRNPERIMDIYENNKEIMADLRKRKDKLTKAEKVNHDRLAMGNRALGQAMVTRNLLDKKQFVRDSHAFLSQNGLQLSLEGVRAVADNARLAGDKAIKAGNAAAKKGGKGMMWMLNEAMS